jgi:hypothetical protein
MLVRCRRRLVVVTVVCAVSVPAAGRSCPARALRPQGLDRPVCGGVNVGAGVATVAGVRCHTATLIENRNASASKRDLD